MPKTKSHSDPKCPCGSRMFEPTAERLPRKEQPALKCTSCGGLVAVDKTTWALYKYAKSQSASPDFLRLFDLH